MVAGNPCGMRMTTDSLCVTRCMYFKVLANIIIPRRLIASCLFNESIPVIPYFDIVVYIDGAYSVEAANARAGDQEARVKHVG